MKALTVLHPVLAGGLEGGDVFLDFPQAVETRNAMSKLRLTPLTCEGACELDVDGSAAIAPGFSEKDSDCL